MSCNHSHDFILTLTHLKAGKHKAGCRIEVHTRALPGLLFQAPACLQAAVRRALESHGAYKDLEEQRMWQNLSRGHSLSILEGQCELEGRFVCAHDGGIPLHRLDSSCGTQSFPIPVPTPLLERLLVAVTEYLWWVCAVTKSSQQAPVQCPQPG